MYYYDTTTEEFGITLQDAKVRANASAPDGSREVGSLVGYDDTDPPDYDPITQALAEAAPKRVNGVWTQQWLVTAHAPDQAAANLAGAKAAKNSQINAARMAANTSSFVHAGKSFACDALSRGDIDGANGFVAIYGAMPPGWPGGWKAIDNSYLEISTVGQWREFYAAMFAAGAANFAKSQTLKAQLDAATTSAEISAINW